MKLVSFIIPCYRSERTIGGVAEEIRSNMHFGGMPENYRMEYEMTLTFYDEAGSVTAVHESGGTYEN